MKDEARPFREQARQRAKGYWYGSIGEGYIQLSDVFEQAITDAVEAKTADIRQAASAVYDSDEDQKIVDLEGASPETAYKNGFLAGIEAVFRRTDEPHEHDTAKRMSELAERRK